MLGLKPDKIKLIGVHRYSGPTLGCIDLSRTSIRRDICKIFHLCSVNLQSLVRRNDMLDSKNTSLQANGKLNWNAVMS
jgi:hypothetical protein